MAISTETVVLKVEGQTEGAVKATDKLTAAQQKLGQAAQSTQASMSGVAQAMDKVPAAGTSSMIGKIGDALKSAGFDAKSFGGGLRDIGKGLTFDLIRTGLKSLNTELTGTAGAALSAAVNGASMGAAFGGPLGAAIGAVGGALVGLTTHTERQTEAQLRAADAARKHAAALQLIAEGETGTRGARRNLRQAEDIAYAEYSAAQLKNVAIQSEASRADVERTQRVWREAQIEREAMNRLDGEIWKEQQMRDQERMASLRLIEAARAKGTIDDAEAAKRIRDLNAAKGDDIVSSYLTKQKETADAVERINRALQNKEITEQQYFEMLRAADDDFRARDDARKKRAEEWAKHAKVRDYVGGMRVEQVTTDTAGSMLGFAAPSAGLSDADSARIRAWEEMKNKRAEMTNAVYGKQANGEFLRLGGENKSALERMFGPLEQFDAYRTAFDGLTGAAGAAMTAWITGSMSAGTAIKKFVGEYLTSQAVLFGIEALKHGAYAIASLIPGPTFNPAAAGGHALAAAKFTGLAALTAVAARGMGKGGTQYGAASSSGGGGASSAYAGSGSGTPQRQQSVTNYYIVGDSNADDSPRMRQRNAERTVEMAQKRTSAGVAE